MLTTPLLELNAEVLYKRLEIQVRMALSGAPDLLVVGINQGGCWLAERLVMSLKLNLPEKLGFIDLSNLSQPVKLPFDVNGATVVLVDDILYTGKTVLRAMNALLECGRPHQVMLAVLIDRCVRRLPICANFFATKILLAEGESLQFARSHGGTFSLELKQSKNIEKK